MLKHITRIKNYHPVLKLIDPCQNLSLLLKINFRVKTYHPVLKKSPRVKKTLRVKTYYLVVKHITPG